MSENAAESGQSPKKNHSKRRHRSRTRKIEEPSNSEYDSGYESSKSTQSTQSNRSTSSRASKHKRPSSQQSSRSSSTSSRHFTSGASQSGSTGSNGKAEVVKKPKKQAKDFRLLEINKLINFYKPLTINGSPVASIPPDSTVEEYLTRICSDSTDAIYVSIIFHPSDPDFPFDLTTVRLSLCVPYGYPNNIKELPELRPTIYVLNDDIPRGFAVNIEYGFNKITKVAAETSRKSKKQEEDIKEQNKEDEDAEGDKIELVNGKGLLSLIQTLDKYLEKFLREDKKDTVKFVKRRGVKAESLPKPEVKEAIKDPKPREARESTLKSNDLPLHVTRKRHDLIEKLKIRLGEEDCKLFKKSDLETVFKINLTLKNQDIKSTYHEIVQEEQEEFSIKLPTRPLPPKAWCLSQKIEVKLAIPYNYPMHDSDLKFSFLSQTLNKLSVDKEQYKYASPESITEMTIKTQEERRYIQRCATNVMENFGHKFRSNKRWKNGESNLTEMLNWVGNNLGACCLPKSQFIEWEKRFKAISS